MSDHHANPQALLAATMPPLLPVGYVAQPSFGIQVIPAPGVRLVAKEWLRVTDGVQEVIEGELWVPVPTGCLAHPLGDPLPADKCHVAVVIITAVVDTLDRGIVGPSGQAPQRHQSIGTHGVLWSEPLDQWQRGHMQALKPSE